MILFPASWTTLAIIFGSLVNGQLITSTTLGDLQYNGSIETSENGISAIVVDSVARTASRTAPAASDELNNFHIVAGGSFAHRKRQSGVDYIDGNGIISNDCLTVPTYRITGGTLVAIVEKITYYYSTEPGIGVQVFAPSLQPGNITTRFSVDPSGALRWQNATFDQGVALFCSVPNATVYAVFDRAARPEGCLEFNVELFDISTCANLFDAYFSISAASEVSTDSSVSSTRTRTPVIVDPISTTSSTRTVQTRSPVIVYPTTTATTTGTVRTRSPVIVYPTTTTTTTTSRSTVTSPGCLTTPTSVAVTFRLYIETLPGELVYVVGSIPQLGSWAPDNALALSADEYEQDNMVWYGTVSIPAGTSFQYKYIRRDYTNNGGAVVWESDPNRQFTITSNCAGQITISDAWNDRGSSSVTPGSDPGVPAGGQCGGSNEDGTAYVRACEAGSECSYQNESYSQCIPTY